MATIKEELEKRGVIPPDGRERIDPLRQALDQNVGQAEQGLWQQFAGQKTLPFKQHEEGQRQFDMSHELAQKHYGLSRDQLTEMMRQFDKNYGLQRDQFGLNQDMFGFDQYKFDRTQDLQEFLGTAPYMHLTASERNRLLYDWAALMEEMPGHLPGQTGGGTRDESDKMVPAREYVESRGGAIHWERSEDGGDIITINGRRIDVQASGGDNVDGTVYLPAHILDAAMGGV